MQGSIGPNLDQNLSHGAKVEPFEDVEVEISVQNEVVYEE